MNTPTKFCKDCAHFAAKALYPKQQDLCLRRGSTPDVVTGLMTPDVLDARKERWFGKCGMDATLFQPKP